MKITRAQLKQIIKEEIEAVDEGFLDKVKGMFGGGKDKGDETKVTGKWIPPRASDDAGGAVTPEKLMGWYRKGTFYEDSKSFRELVSSPLINALQKLGCKEVKGEWSCPIKPDRKGEFNPRGDLYFKIDDIYDEIGSNVRKYRIRQGMDEGRSLDRIAQKVEERMVRRLRKKK